MYYVVVDIGCIECHESSNVLGIFTSKDKAEEIRLKYETVSEEDWHGEHSFEIFEIDKIDNEQK